MWGYQVFKEDLMAYIWQGLPDIWSRGDIMSPLILSLNLFTKCCNLWLLRPVERFRSRSDIVSLLQKDDLLSSFIFSGYCSDSPRPAPEVTSCHFFKVKKIKFFFKSIDNI